MAVVALTHVHEQELMHLVINVGCWLKDDAGERRSSKTWEEGTGRLIRVSSHRWVHTTSHVHSWLYVYSPSTMMMALLHNVTLSML